MGKSRDRKPGDNPALMVRLADIPDRDEAIRVCRRKYGYSLAECAEMVDIEHGRSLGDVVLPGDPRAAGAANG